MRYSFAFVSLAVVSLAAACSSGSTPPTPLSLSALRSVGSSDAAVCSQTQPTPTPSAQPSVPTSPTPKSDPTLKPPLTGLLDMGCINFYTEGVPQASFTTAYVAKYRGLFGGVVINATWAELQPNDTPVIAKSNIIDYALGQIRAYNRIHSNHHLYAKLRVWGGNTAPQWAKQIGGGPITIYDPTKGTLTFGPWWNATYAQKWRTFQTLLAKEYDRRPLIRVVAVTSCASLTDEPFVGEFDDAQDVRALVAAGYTDAKQEHCLLNATEDYAAWKTMRVDYTFSLFHHIVISPSSPSPTPPAGDSPIRNASSPADPAFTTKVMLACRSSLHDRCILNNHALNCPLPNPDAFVYELARKLGGPINYQTASTKKTGSDLTSVIENGTYYGASAIELWPRTFTALPRSAIAQLARILKTGEEHAPACPLVSPSPTSSPASS